MSSHDYLPSASPLTVRSAGTVYVRLQVKQWQVSAHDRGGDHDGDGDYLSREEHNHGDGDQGERSDVWQHDVVAITASTIRAAGRCFAAIEDRSSPAKTKEELRGSSALS
ncbi:hypothetical protein PF011_g6862 [Phytophthora fragariae]|uniref:Uncharacterized protein n=1 Tax=Phytophthora fragariae TaxID=53985 RepID=A0A6A3LFF4_9STRA|nr:hypothetical protein PF011_g6862 [Phytophthora fragariae]